MRKRIPDFTKTMKNLIPLLLIAAVILPVSAQEKKNNATWTDPATAKAEDPDFSIQGEYGRGLTGQAWGVQVVALGDGKFDAYLLEGGLPGLGWTKEKQRIKLSGTAGELKSGDGKLTASIADGAIAVKKEGTELATLSRIERKSPTLGAKPPEGAVILFDGTSGDQWHNGKVEDGLLPNLDITTKKKFGGYTIHLEFRTPYKPHARGQGRGNSGVYHQGRYETQVLDSFGLEGKMNETGGLYSIADPSINMCFPPLTWQTYDVDLTNPEFDADGKITKNARMTVKLNGVVVQDNVELPKPTPGSKLKDITPEPGAIYIQHHGNPVYYRNIWLVEKK